MPQNVIAPDTNSLMLANVTTIYIKLIVQLFYNIRAFAKSNYFYGILVQLTKQILLSNHITVY